MSKALQISPTIHAISAEKPLSGFTKAPPSEWPNPHFGRPANTKTGELSGITCSGCRKILETRMQIVAEAEGGYDEIG